VLDALGCGWVEEVIVITTSHIRLIAALASMFCSVTLRAQAVSSQPARPFRSYGLAVTAGSGGLGIQVATPLAREFNLRANASYFSYYGQFNTDGLNLNGRVQIRQANLCLDWFPFRSRGWSGFRVSPGVTVANRDDVHATISVPPGGTFELGDATYTSAPGQPVAGTTSLSFGNHVAPSITVGYGNLVPRNGSHFSVPVEVGFQYTGAPLISLNLQGTACDQNNDCGNLQTDPSSLQNEQQQVATDNNTIRLLRFYPIVSVGFGFTF
jgi:hypothetical protein